MRRVAGAVTGVLAAAVALGTAELAAALTGPGSSPVIAVGAGFIDLTPRPLKDFAIRTFGQYDKAALLVGTGVLLLVFAVLIGLLTLRRRQYGVVGIALFGLVGVLAAMTRPAAGMLDWLPSLVGALAGIGTLLALARAFPVPGALPTAGPATAGEPASRPWPEAEPGPEGGPVPATGLVSMGGVDRRRLLVGGAVAAGVAVVSGGLGRVLSTRLDVSAARDAVRLPAPASPAAARPSGVDFKVRRLTPYVTRNDEFYRVDTALILPRVRPDEWRLRIHGRVANPVTLTFDDLLRRDLIERDVTIACVSNEVGGNLAGNARWLGAPLKALLDEVRPEAGADQIVSRSSDGWTCGTPTAACLDGRDAMLAVAMNGEPLPVAHGFPVRMIVPGLYGYVSATKWVVDLELTSFADFDPYWIRRGWASRAPIKTASRIDTPRDSVAAGPVTVAGVAWAQQRGIDKVEVRVDRGAWQVATLAAEGSVDTWRQWRWEWPAEPGSHVIECRATDRTGAAQPERKAPPFPDGATGWHSVVVDVSA